MGRTGVGPHYAVGWAHAMCTPYQWTKQVASHWGGTRNGTIVTWPRGIQAKGERRHQFHHVIDVAPTILEAAGLPEPAQVNGITQKPLEGVSMAYSDADADTADRHQTQYIEIFGNRGIYRFDYECTDVGRDALSPVTADYPPGDTAFTGTIKLIELESGNDCHDHLIDPARFIHLIMAKQ